MRVEFDPRALEDIENIYQYIAADSPRNATAVVDRIVLSVSRLGEFPEMARAGRVDGTRELVVPRLPYVAVYKVDMRNDVLTVVAVFHGARDRLDARD
jgi:addiction module RelE/StbE family toxin